VRSFTVAEAEALIPELERIFEAIAGLAAQAEVKAASLRARQEAGAGDGPEAVIERSQLQFLVEGVNDWMRKIVDLGALPKGVEPALVDFPHRMNGRDVYLCWRLGEKKIGHYHGTEDGFSGRKPLPRRRPS
jgi:hypothetical protein